MEICNRSWGRPDDTSLPTIHHLTERLLLRYLSVVLAVARAMRPVGLTAPAPGPNGVGRQIWKKEHLLERRYTPWKLKYLLKFLLEDGNIRFQNGPFVICGKGYSTCSLRQSCSLLMRLVIPWQSFNQNAPSLAHSKAVYHFPAALAV